MISSQSRSPTTAMDAGKGYHRQSPDDSDSFDSKNYSSHDYRADKCKDYYGKDMTDHHNNHHHMGNGMSRSNSYDHGSDLYFDQVNAKRDPFGMTRDSSPKSRDSFGMPSSRDIGVVPNTRDSFTVTRQMYKPFDTDTDRRSSVASTNVSYNFFMRLPTLLLLFFVNTGKRRVVTFLV